MCEGVGQGRLFGGTGREATIREAIIIFISLCSLHDRQGSVVIFIQSILARLSPLLFLYGCRVCRVLLLFWRVNICDT